MITTLLGKNSYMLLEKKQQIIDAFNFEVGSLGVEKYDSETDTQVIYDALNNLPFLVTKKLVVIDEPSLNKELSDKLPDWLKENEQINALIVEPNIDKRTAWYKYLIQNSTVMSCDALDEHNTRLWVKDFVKKHEASITDGAVNLLLKNVGLDQQQLANEIDKLRNYNPTITEDSVKLLVDPMPQETIFSLLEALTNGDKNRTIKLYETLRLSGIEANEILAMIGWQIHKVLLVKASLSANQGESGLHPFVVQKNTKLAKKLSMKELEKLVTLVADAELSIKKNGLSSSSVVSVLIFKILELLNDKTA